MKITVISSYFPTSTRPYGGNSAFHTLRLLKRCAGLEIDVVCPLVRYPGWLAPGSYERADVTYRPPEFPTAYVEYPAMPLVTRPFNGAACARLLLPYVRKTRPELILSYWVYPDGYAAVRIGRALGVPVIVGAIGSDLRTRNDPFTIRLVRKTLKEANAVITVSRELRELAIRMGAPPDKVTAILNGCDTTVFHPGDRAEARRQVGVEATGELIVFAGNLIESKGLGELMTAFIGLAKSRPRARLAILGKGIYGETLAARAAEAGLRDRVTLAGGQDAAGVAKWMRAADVFCLPSYSEGCPNVVVEALSSGRPVVATNVGGIPELVNGNCGILVPPRNSDVLRGALEAALAKEWDQEEIARTYRRSWEEVAGETFDVCRKVLTLR
jgi:teichuronic acid biosynthesis glycosyltransferase TuaC